MKFLVIVIILGAGGYFGYNYLNSEAPADGAATEEAAIGSETIDIDVADVPDMVPVAGGGDLAPATNAGGMPIDVGGAPDQLPPAAQAAYDEAEKTWQGIVAKGGNPVIEILAPTMLQQYSRALRATYAKPALSDFANKLVNERLRPLAEKVFFSSVPYLNEPSNFIQRYEVKAGDQPQGIGRPYGLSYQMINYMRGADPESGTLSIGDSLKIVNVKEDGYYMHIDKSDYRMDVYIGGRFAKRYPVGHGAVETPTPAGKTHIKSRVKYPQWTHPKTKAVYDYGDPNNILGPVWLAFDNAIGKSGLGIHGYTGEDGKATRVMASNGCIRMENDQALELHNILVPCGMYQSGFISRAPMNVEIVE